MSRIGELISRYERRAMEAERETVDRYVAAYLAEKTGEIIDARITGVQNFGFFATVEGLGGDGLVPVSTLGAERFIFDEAEHADRKSTRLNSGHYCASRMPSSACNKQLYYETHKQNS